MPEFYRLRPLFCVKMKNLPAGRAVAESAYLGRFGMKKAPCVFAESQFIPVDIKSDCAGNLAGTEAPRANIDMARSAVNDSLYAANVGLPSTVGTSVRMGNLDTKSYTLAANFTLCHLSFTSLSLSFE